jgi:hypothetical protein
MGEIISQDVSGRLKRSLGHYTDLTSLTSQLAEKVSQINGVKPDSNGNVIVSSGGGITAFISDYPRLAGETDDTARFNRAISYVTSQGGGKLKLELQTYNLNSFTIPSSVSMEGIVNKDPWSTTATVLKFIGTGTFITINSYYDKKAKLHNVNLITSTIVNRNNPSTAINILYSGGSWGGCADIDYVTIEGFGVGIQHQMTYQSSVKHSQIWDCGIGIIYNPKVGNAAGNIATTFGNVNIVENTTIIQCNIGVVLAGDTMNEFKNCDFEKNYIAVQTYQLGNGYPPPTKHIFNQCWIEANGWASDTDKTNNINPRYVICNSPVDSNFTATGVNSADIPIFKNCVDALNVTPEIPSFNGNYQMFSLTDDGSIKNIMSDSSLTTLYNYPAAYSMLQVTAGKNNAARNIFKVSNHGTTATMNFNTSTFRQNYTTTGVTTQTMDIPWSDYVSADPVNGYQFANTAFLNITILGLGGVYSHALFMVCDQIQYVPLHIFQMGDTYHPNDGQLAVSIINNNINMTTARKTFTIQVTGTNLQSIFTKITNLPNATLING